MSISDWIQIIVGIITACGVLSSIIISVKTLKQNNEMIEESSKAHIIFYVDYHPQTSRYYLVIKNFGNSVGELLNVEVTPKLDWQKCNFKQDIKPLTESTNVLLAPNQKISSWFDFNDYPDKIFNVKLTYKTINKIYTENYKIDLSFIDNLDWLHNYAFDDNTDDYKEVLYRINNSILEVSDRIE